MRCVYPTPGRHQTPSAVRGDADDRVRVQDVPDPEVHRELEVGELLVEDQPSGLRAPEVPAEAREERDQPVRVGRIGEREVHGRSAVEYRHLKVSHGSRRKTIPRSSDPARAPTGRRRADPVWSNGLMQTQIEEL